MLVDLIQRPEDYRYNIRRYSTSLTTTMVYGWRTPTYDVPYVKEMFQVGATMPRDSGQRLTIKIGDGRVL